ncbi:hypothetical protein V3C99_005898 [Haemonchus contortus]
MPGKPKRKSSKKRKHKTKGGKKRDRRSKEGRKRKTKTSKKHRKGSRPPREGRGSKKRRSSKKHRKRSKSPHEQREKPRHRRKSKEKEPPVNEMTAAARNEDLGNIVLVKNRHKVQQQRGSKEGIPQEPPMGAYIQGPAPPPQRQRPRFDAQAPGGPSSGPSSGQKSGEPPRSDQQQIDMRYPPMEQPPSDVKMPPSQEAGFAAAPASAPTMIPIGAPPATGPPPSMGAPPPREAPPSMGAPPPREAPPSMGAPPPMAPTPSTSTSATTGTTVPTTIPTTTGAPSDTYVTGFQLPTPPTPTSQQFPSDEMTKKEAEVPEKHADKGQKWKAYMEKALDGGVEGMNNEFRSIRGYLPPMATRIGFDANPEKNRFEDIVCIDQTRVRLSTGSYIHANWVNIGPGKKAIVTQLPNVESGADFWQMVLDVDAQGILLFLTHAEFTMFNANSVFPAEQDFLHFDGSHVRVGEFKRVKIDREWTMHVISVRSKNQRKYVHVHHYSGWTHGKQIGRLIDMWQLQSVFRRYSHPHIYMSLSGCGRAGTFAAFQIAHERLHSDNAQRLAISDCVCRARQGRMHAVQRDTQMLTIHAAIMEHIMSTKFSVQLQPKTIQKYGEFIDLFVKNSEGQEILP